MTCNAIERKFQANAKQKSHFNRTLAAAKQMKESKREEMPSVIVMGASVNTSSLRAKQIQLKTEPATLSCIAYALACNLISLQATQAAMCLAR